MSGFVFDEITTSTPEKSLLAPIKKKGGRNNMGRITVRHRGGGHKRRYRIIDFLRNKINIPAKVVSIEYDPNRTARISLLHYADGEKRYILTPEGLNVRGVVMNPVDHPHGGGEGRTSGGRHPVSPWGKPTKGMKTRHRKGADKLIVKKR